MKNINRFKMLHTPRARGSRGVALALLGVLGGLTGCDSLECGDGTYREGDRCQPAVQVGCGAGTIYADGRCVLSADAAVEGDTDGFTCGPGTAPSGGQCRPSPDGGEPDATVRDRGVVDMGPIRDADLRDFGDGEAPDLDLPDVAIPDADVPDAEPPPACPFALQPGNPPAACAAIPPGGHCVVGLALDFTTGCALPAGLPIAVIDPVLALQGQNPTIGVGAVAAGGGFAVGAVGPAGQLALIIDEAPDTPPAGDEWARALNGVTASPLSGETYRTVAFSTPTAVVRAWSVALGLAPEALLNRGFLVGRALDAERRPIAGARLRGRANANLTACGAGAPCLRYFREDGQGFEPLGTEATTALGAFLVLGPGDGVVQDSFYLQDREAEYADIPAGISPGSGFHTAFVPRP